MIYERKSPLVPICEDIFIIIIAIISALLSVKISKPVLAILSVLGALVFLVVMIITLVKRSEIKSMEITLTNKIKGEREIICGSFARTRGVAQTFFYHDGMFYLTSFGMEFYSSKENFAIPFKDIINVTLSDTDDDINITTESCVYSINFETEAIAAAYLKHYKKRVGKVANTRQVPVAPQPQVTPALNYQQQYAQPQVPQQQVGYQQPVPPQASYPNQQAWGYQYPNQMQYAPYSNQQPMPPQQPMAYPYQNQQAGAYQNNMGNQQNNNGNT